MKPTIFPTLASIIVAFASVAAATAAEVGTAVNVRAFLKQHCVRCHGVEKQEGDVRLDDLLHAATVDTARWSTIGDQLRDGLMPPEGEPRPAAEQVRGVIAWIAEQTGARAARLPNQGNLIPHEALFKSEPALDSAAAGPARLWRLSPDGYLGFVRDVYRGRSPAIVQPFSLIPERGIKDFASLYVIDEPSTEILVRNAEAIVAWQTAHEIVDGKPRGKNDTVREFIVLMDPTTVPTTAQLEAAVQTQFRLAIGRQATADEVARFNGLYEKCATPGDRPGAARTMLAAVLLRADAMFRSERGEATATGRTRLSPRETALAVGAALTDHKERGLLTAAEKGELSTKEQIADHLRRIFDDPKIEKPRLLGFFHDYFGYDDATEVFKDRPKDLMYEPRQYVSDTDRLVLHILAEDRDVLRQLLTTPRSFVNFTLAENKETHKKDVPKRALVPNAHNHRGMVDVEGMYGLREWVAEQPVTLPADTRLGILMQPSWLIAWSTNFDNDPVRRGRWIRERLLGGTVPDLPIGVAAQVPDDPHRTFRDRLQVTRDARCWKCHRRMDDLGLPFENFDHYGRFRTTEAVLDVEATAQNLDKKGNSLGPVFRQADLNTTGLVADSGDSRLEGPVHDPRELILRLAESERVRQVFVRHVFRYYLGRNETLADARTLQEADRAYVAAGGSFRALLISLFTSDSFLYRLADAPPPASSIGANP